MNLVFDASNAPEKTPNHGKPHLSSDSSCETQLFSSDTIRLRISKTTTTIPLLRHNGTSTESSIETTAAIRTIRITFAGARDELRSCGRRPAGCRTGYDNSGQCGTCLHDCSGAVGCNGRRTSKAQSHSGSVIWLSVSESASSVSFLSNDGAGAQSCVESTTAVRAVCV